MLLSEFAGNDKVTTELSESMKNDILPHTIIIDGEKGTGKQTLANMISQYCVCLSEDRKPCGICQGCMKAQKKIHPDIVVVNGENSAEVSVDSIRNIRASAYIKANEAPNKVFVLQNCNKMLAPAQNAFLKVLEEPPENVVFVMTVSSASNLLQTVRSRARIFSLYPVSSEEALLAVKRQMPEKSDEEIRQAVSESEGNIGTAMVLLNSGTDEIMQLVEQIYAAIFLSSEYQLLVLTSMLAKNRSFAVNAADLLTEIAAEAVKASLGLKVKSKAAADAAKRIPQNRLIHIQNQLQKARSVLNTNINLNFFCTWLCSALRS